MSKRITAEQLNAFVTPAIEALEKLARLPTQVGTLRRQTWSVLSEIPVILIGVKGDLNGKVIFQFSPPILKQILISLLGEPSPSLSNSICWDAVGEVANIITGNAVGRLEALGLRTTITPPEVLLGEAVKRLITNREGIIIPIESPLGEIGISIFLEN